MQLRPTTSLSRLYDLLADGHPLTQEEARDALELKSTRQVRRLLEQLEGEGIPKGYPQKR